MYLVVDLFFLNLLIFTFSSFEESRFFGLFNAFTPIISAPRSLRLDCHEFQASLGYGVRPCQKK